MTPTLTPELEAQAQQLAAQLKEQAGDQFLAVARLLVATEERTLFGQTEFDVRDQVLKLGAYRFQGSCFARLYGFLDAYHQRSV